MGFYDELERRDFLDIMEAGQDALENKGENGLAFIEKRLPKIEKRISDGETSLEIEQIISIYLSAIYCARFEKNLIKVCKYASLAVSFSPDTNDGKDFMFEILSLGTGAATAVVEDGGNPEILRFTFPVFQELYRYVNEGFEKPQIKKIIMYYAHLCEKHGIV